MFRLLGFLIGSATAMTIILLVVGIPDFHLTDPGIDQQHLAVGLHGDLGQSELQIALR